MHQQRKIVLASLYHTYRTLQYRLVLQVVARPVFKPQRVMGLGHSTSLVLSTQVNLLCKDANKFTQFVLFKKCMHWGSSMHACQPELDTGILQHIATAVLLVIVQLDHV